MSLLNHFRHQLIVSVQAAGLEPLNEPEHLVALAKSAINGGAKGLRTAQVENIQAFKRAMPHIPLIGLTKPEPPPEDILNEVFITPTFAHCRAVAMSGADFVACDATGRPRPGKETLTDIVRQFKEHFPNHYLMADCATLNDGLFAASIGFDVVGTTLAGYTQETAHLPEEEPDFQLLEALCAKVQCPVILEGRVWEPAHVRRAFELGAFAVVVGSAISRPQVITRRFVGALP